MGLGNHMVEAIAREHAYRRIDGDVLFIGRQTVYLTPDELRYQLQRHGHYVDISAIELNTQTVDRIKGHENRDLVSDRSIFAALGNKRVKALDVDAYEGAEIIHDLNLPLPDDLKGIADFVVDGSTLDNTFSPAQTLRNFADLLRPGGRLLMVNAFSTFETAYVILPPLWYYDYFIQNTFADVKVYVVVPDKERVSIYAIDPNMMAARRREMGHLGSAYPMFTIVFAEKGESSTSDQIPTQQHYRPPDQWDRFLDRLSFVQRAHRPHLLASSGTPVLDDYPGGYKWIDKDYLPQDIPPIWERQ